MVSGGMGVTLLPKIAADGGAAAGAHVAVRPFAQPLVGRSIGVAWREGGQREEEARMLADVLRNELFGRKA
jgi:LysR family hydrogen peroxide-inducible transcriptional activator